MFQARKSFWVMCLASSGALVSPEKHSLPHAVASGSQSCGCGMDSAPFWWEKTPPTHTLPRQFISVVWPFAQAVAIFGCCFFEQHHQAQLDCLTRISSNVSSNLKRPNRNLVTIILKHFKYLFVPCHGKKQLEQYKSRSFGSLKFLLTCCLCCVIWTSFFTGSLNTCQFLMLYQWQNTYSFLNWYLYIFCLLSSHTHVVKSSTRCQAPCCTQSRGL